MQNMMVSIFLTMKATVFDTHRTYNLGTPETHCNVMSVRKYFMQYVTHIFENKHERKW